MPSERVFDDERTLAFLDIHPAGEGHTLVVPRTHAVNVFDVSDEDWDAVWRTSRRVALAIREAPKPVLAAVAIFSFQFAWNDFLNPLIYLGPNPDLWTLALALNALKGGEGQMVEMNLLMVLTTFMILPMLLMFAFGQKYMVRGVAFSGEQPMFADRPIDLRPPLEVPGTHDYLTEIHLQAEAFVRTNAPLHTIEDVIGKRVAFTSRTGSSGFLMPIGWLIAHDHIRPVGNELTDLEAALQASFAATTDAGGYQQALQALVARRRQLVTMLVAERNRLAISHPAARASNMLSLIPTGGGDIRTITLPVHIEHFVATQLGTNPWSWKIADFSLEPPDRFLRGFQPGIAIVAAAHGGQHHPSIVGQAMLLTERPRIQRRQIANDVATVMELAVNRRRDGVGFRHIVKVG